MAGAAGQCSDENPAWLTYAASGIVAVCPKTDTDLLQLWGAFVWSWSGFMRNVTSPVADPRWSKGHAPNSWQIVPPVWNCCRKFSEIRATRWFIWNSSPPRTPLGELTTLSQTPWSPEEGDTTSLFATPSESNRNVLSLRRNESICRSQ